MYMQLDVTYIKGEHTLATTVGLISLGCSKNRVDSEQALGFLKDRGYQIVADPAKAEVIIVNTCGFIQPAKEEAISTIFEMAEYKEVISVKVDTK